MIFKRILIFFLITITAALFLTGCTPSLFAPPLNAYVITSTASTGGSINPGGEVVVIEGQDKTFTIIPDEGYQVSDVLVDGISVGAVNSYTFPSVGDFHAIQADFTIIAPRVVNIDTGIEYNSIQKAIDDALSGQTLVAYPAIYKEIIFIDKNITLRSTDPLDSSVVASTVIEGRYGPLVEISTGDIYSGESALEGFTILNAEGYEGGGVKINYANATISNNVISGTSAIYGGAIYISPYSRSIIKDNTIKNNSATYGGGIYVEQMITNNTITNNTIAGNYANYGGGIWVEFYDDEDIDQTWSYLQIGGEHSEDTGDYNIICGNSPKLNQLNYTNYYPDNYISDVCN